MEKTNKKILEEIKGKKLIEGYNIIFVDDGSNDGTFEILEKFCQKDLSVKALSLSRNFGHQAALSAGLRFSKRFLSIDRFSWPAGSPYFFLYAGSLEILVAHLSTAKAKLARH